MPAIIRADNCHQYAIINVCNNNAYALVLRPRTMTECHEMSTEFVVNAKGKMPLDCNLIDINSVTFRPCPSADSQLCQSVHVR